MVIVLADVANLASTALTIAIQRDWIVVITGYNRGHLAGMDITSVSILLICELEIIYTYCILLANKHVLYLLSKNTPHRRKKQLISAEFDGSMLLS